MGVQALCGCYLSEKVWRSPKLANVKKKWLLKKKEKKVVVIIFKFLIPLLDFLILMFLRTPGEGSGIKKLYW